MGSERIWTEGGAGLRGCRRAEIEAPQVGISPRVACAGVVKNSYALAANLFSQRDTHVWSTTVPNSPMLEGWLLSYNHSSYLGPACQIEPSL